MGYTGFERLWLFFAFSFFGWVLETAMAAVRRRRLVNRGLVNGPLCVIYGITGTALLVVCRELHGIWLFLGSMIFSTLAEWIAGHVIEKMYHERWWDYSGITGNLDGYICLPVSIFWGALGTITMHWGAPVLVQVFRMIPRTPGHLLMWILTGVLVLDITATICILSGRSRRIRQWEGVDSWLTGVSSRLERNIYRWVDHRIRNAYPEAAYREELQAEAEQRKTTFAYGLCFYKIVLLLIIGAFLGDLVETIFCRVTAGVWMSRSSFVWGPFSIVWGVALAAATMLLYRYRNYSDRFLFFMGTFLGGAYEYTCSVLTELCFGKVFWDYSKIPFNLGGRINLLYCFFWGIAAVVWIKGIYPVMSAWIEKIPMKFGKEATWLLLIFFCVDIAVSGLALVRSSEREKGIPADSVWQQVMDEHYGDEVLKKIYPNALKVESPSGSRSGTRTE